MPRAPIRFFAARFKAQCLFPDRLVKVRSRLVDLVKAQAAADADDPVARGWVGRLCEKGRRASASTR